MTDTPEGAPSKRAMELASRLDDILESPLNGARRNAARLLDAEFAKEREAERERCWKIANFFPSPTGELRQQRAQIAAAIRAGAPPAPDRAEASEELAKAVEAVLHGDYPRPPKNDQCKHGSWSWHGCEACIDEFLEAALSAYRGSQK